MTAKRPALPGLASMTGFARSGGQAGTAHWSWEMKSVNARGLELRLRVPPGFDALEAAGPRPLWRRASGAGRSTPP